MDNFLFHEPVHINCVWLFSYPKGGCSIMYKPIHTLDELKTYLSGATHVAFDFETAPDTKYRKEEKAALDAHKSISLGLVFR